MKDRQVIDINTNPDQGRAFASRRTIIKGLTSAVPIVMTVGCGKAMANASSFQCITAPVQEPVECIDSQDYPDGDGWLRTATPQNGTTTTDTEAQQCLVYVDQDGTQVSSRTDGLPVTLSCYSSFM